MIPASPGRPEAECLISPDSVFLSPGRRTLCHFCNISWSPAICLRAGPGQSVFRPVAKSVFLARAKKHIQMIKCVEMSGAGKYTVRK